MSYIARHRLQAFLAVIGAIVVLALVGAFTGKTESATLSAAITGLIGVAGTFRPQQQEHRQSEETP